MHIVRVYDASTLGVCGDVIVYILNWACACVCICAYLAEGHTHIAFEVSYEALRGQRPHLDLLRRCSHE